MRLGYSLEALRTQKGSRVLTRDLTVPEKKDLGYLLETPKKRAKPKNTKKKHSFGNEELAHTVLNRNPMS